MGGLDCWFWKFEAPSGGYIGSSTPAIRIQPPNEREAEPSLAFLKFPAKREIHISLFLVGIWHQMTMGNFPISWLTYQLGDLPTNGHSMFMGTF